MTITLNVSELNFSSKPQTIEAYRRAIEIREFATPVNSAANGQIEYFIWSTKTAEGEELEEVVIDQKRGLIRYSMAERNSNSAPNAQFVKPS